MRVFDTISDDIKAILNTRICDLGLKIEGSKLEPLIDQMYSELKDKGLQKFHPACYLSDEWGCPSGEPVIGIPFYLADPRLAELESQVNDLESEIETMMYLRHEAGHAINYAYKLHRTAEWKALFGPFRRPYRDAYKPIAFSRRFVRHIAGWYAQKHPDEDFAETFAVWLTPGFNWRESYDGWGALRKLEYVDSVMKEIAHQVQPVPEPSEDDLPVAAMRYTVAEHYEDEESIPIRDPRIFDGDLRTIFVARDQAPGAASAADFIAHHRREIVARISYWTGESASVVRQFVDFLVDRTRKLELQLGGLEASTLIELTAFGTAVMMNYRHTNTVDGGKSPKP